MFYQKHMPHLQLVFQKLIFFFGTKICAFVFEIFFITYTE